MSMTTVGVKEILSPELYFPLSVLNKIGFKSHFTVNKEEVLERF